MRVVEVRKRVEEIAALGKTDPEVAHSEEMRLYVSVLRAIAAKQCAYPAQCAAEAAKVADMDFPRW